MEQPSYLEPRPQPRVHEIDQMQRSQLKDYGNRALAREDTNVTSQRLAGASNDCHRNMELLLRERLKPHRTVQEVPIAEAAAIQRSHIQFIALYHKRTKRKITSLKERHEQILIDLRHLAMVVHKMQWDAEQVIGAHEDHGNGECGIIREGVTESNDVGAGWAVV